MGCALLAAPAAGEDTIDFDRDIRPILAHHCFSCHGPDKQESGLRLDLKARTLAGGDSAKPALVPGKPAETRILAVVRGDDPDLFMPPEGESLSAEQIAIMTRWVAAGAERPDDPVEEASDHWAFVAPVRPSLPDVDESGGWSRNAIDRFILARLEAEELAPSPEADRYTLIRRVYLDLIGLPPTPDEADAFAADTRPDAYERLVDRLLASPHYGERWARRWLDLARYADTNGYEKDRDRSIWAYRDWVISALNADVPFDQFTIRQIAGDMLPGATLDDQIATGFHRNTMINEEGGIDVEEFRFHAMVDRVNTTGTAWLGLSIGCAQCHTHKYDPIHHREYYGLMALLDNADEPEIDVPDPHVATSRAEIEAQIASIQAGLEAKFVAAAGAADESAGQARLEARFAEWMAQAVAEVRPWTAIKPTSVVSQGGATMSVLDDDSVLVSGDKPNRDIYVVELAAPLDSITAIRLEVLPDPSLPDGGPGRAPLYSVGDFLLSEFRVAAAPLASGESVAIELVEPSHDFAQADRSAALAIDNDLDTGWAIQGAVGEPHQSVFPLKAPLVNAGGSWLVVTLDQHYIHQMTIGRFRLSVTGDPRPAKATSLSTAIESILAKPDDDRSDADRATLKQYFLSIAPELEAEHKQIADLKKSLPKHPTTMVMQERDPEHRRITQRRHRGEFLKRIEEIAPSVPDVLPELPADAPRDRLALARWLVDPANPLTARVAVNRHWQAFFGTGLVRTVEDFGTQGERPTHPELLDWLATELVAQGWSVKALHRQMVSSAAYRQSSRVAPDLAARDPRNDLLARGPRLRLEAELVRDSALTAAGLIQHRIGGPSVYPPQPEGTTSLAYGAPTWPTSAGADRYRRGLYTFTKRTSPYAAFVLFDAPSGESMCARRDRSNTPLQALTTLNDAVFIEAAQALARRVTSQGPSDPASRIALAYRLCLTRPAETDELAAIVEFHDAQLARLRSGELDAVKIAGIDPTNPPPGIDPAELAAMTTVARALLNLDETLNRE